MIFLEHKELIPFHHKEFSARSVFLTSGVDTRGMTVDSFRGPSTVFRIDMRE
jgi:hypothetical protein